MLSATATPWLILWALASADASGQAWLTLHTATAPTLQQCRWREAPDPAVAHADPITHPGSRRRCAERARLPAGCLHVQVAVVRDFDGALLVDLEHEPGWRRATDPALQRRAREVSGVGERGAILARWPAGAWTDVRLCPAELGAGPSHVGPVPAPSRCALLSGSGKPWAARFERPGEVHCAVLAGAVRHGVEAWAQIPHDRSEDGIEALGVGSAAGPARWLVSAGRTLRVRYRLAGDYAGAWHTDYVVVSVAR